VPTLSDLAELAECGEQKKIIADHKISFITLYFTLKTYRYARTGLCCPIQGVDGRYVPHVQITTWHGKPFCGGW